MSLSPEFIAKARALAFYRKLKIRRARKAGEKWGDSDAPAGWHGLGAGHFGEAWEHKDHQGFVVKISGRAGFGHGDMRKEKPSLDGWPAFAQHCQAHPHPNLPNILHFERLSVGISYGIMPVYLAIDSWGNANDSAIVAKWQDHLKDGKGAPEWMWPIIGMRYALGMDVDLHGGNVMVDPTTREYIMTDPFSFVS